MSLTAYRRTNSMTEAPRAAERRLMTEITAEMIAARDAEGRGQALIEPLHRNRELWGVFSATCGAQGNELPKSLRASIISLALWVDRYTTHVVAGREPIDELISVNMVIIDGLGALPTQNAAAG